MITRLGRVARAEHPLGRATHYEWVPGCEAGAPASHPRRLLLGQALDHPEQGDRYGFALTSTGGSLANVAAGAPGEDLFSVVDAGVVSVLVGTLDQQDQGGGGLTGLSGPIPQLLGSTEPGDSFGQALATSGL